MGNYEKKFPKLCKNWSQINEQTMKKQVRKSDGKSIENIMVSDGAEPR